MDVEMKKIYDCHIHMLNNALINDESEHKNIFPDADLKVINEWHNILFPGREINNLSRWGGESPP